MFASLNNMLFIPINANVDTGASGILFAIFWAQYQVFIAVIFLPIGWCDFLQRKETIVKTVVAIVLSLTLVTILPAFINRPRPCVTHLGASFLVHVTLIVTNVLLILKLYFNAPWTDWLWIVLTWIVGGSQVYSRVYWARDIIATIIFVLWCAYTVNKNGSLFTQLFNLLFLKISRRFAFSQ